MEIKHRTQNTAGMRVTKQRALILEIIRNGRGHVDADEIYRQARKELPRLSLSTVYRSLQAFKKSGLVEEVHFDESHHHYEAKPAAEHYHLVCASCGRVIEFHYPLARNIKRDVAEAKDFDIVESEVRITGFCSRCRRDRR